MPSPYRRAVRSSGGGGVGSLDCGSSISLLSSCSYRRLNETAGGGGTNGSGGGGHWSGPPPKPQRTYTHTLNKQNKSNKSAPLLSATAGNGTASSLLQTAAAVVGGGTVPPLAAPVVGDALIAGPHSQATTNGNINTKENIVPRSDNNNNNHNNSNSNNKQAINKLTNYVVPTTSSSAVSAVAATRQARSESFRNIVNLKLHSDMLQFINRQKGRYRTASDNFKHLPYLQTRV